MKRQWKWFLLALATPHLSSCGDDSSASETGTDACSDGADNDGDGHVDCDDQDCEELVLCLAGGDGDGDADVDGDADSDGDGDTDADADGDGEVCNGLDDDGDGQVDEGSPGSGVACLTGLQGRCEQGLTGCAGGAIDCYPNVDPVDESCANPGEDDDCDGEVDDVEGLGGECVTGLGGACSAGVNTCVQGVLVCAPSDAQPEPPCANGIDEDCNGEVDDGPPPGDETCGNMGTDDDCDGRADDIDDLGNDCDTGLLSLCANGLWMCEDEELVCDPITDPAEERCDTGGDEDCDGTTDEADCLDPNLHHTGYGYEWIDGVLAGTYDNFRAFVTCTNHLSDLGQDDVCDFTCQCGDEGNRSHAISNRGIDQEVRRCWFYDGEMIGLTTTEADACNVEEAATWD